MTPAPTCSARPAPTIHTCRWACVPFSHSAEVTSTPHAPALKLRVGSIRYAPGLATYHGYVAELALWERRWIDADEAVGDGMIVARPGWGTQIRVWLGASGLRAHAELAALARARRDADDLRRWLGRARHLLASARRARGRRVGDHPQRRWLARHCRSGVPACRGVPRPELWSVAAARWDRLERPPVAAYCRWRHAEALAALGGSRTRSEPTAP